MQFMVIERFKGGNPKPVYERFAAKGRMLPAGVEYDSSWITEDGATCYQVMLADDPDQLQDWIERWSDLVDFEVIPVIGSAEAAARFR